MIETVGCGGLEARSTFRYPDSVRSSTGQTSKICPDLGTYPASRPGPDVQDSAAVSVDPAEPLRVRYNSMEVPVEVKHEAVKRASASSTGTPATDTPPSSSASIPASLPQVVSTPEADFSVSSPEGGAAVLLGLKAHWPNDGLCHRTLQPPASSLRLHDPIRKRTGAVPALR